MTQITKTIRKIAGAVAALCAVATATGAQKVAAEVSDQLQVGDRIALTVEGPAAFSDTLVVRDGEVVQIPNIGEVSVKGVGRSQVQTFMSQEIAKYIKSPTVHAKTLIRIAVVGAVARPGFYSVPADYVLSDVLMEAGGPANSADVNRTKIQRGDKKVVSEKGVSQALASGWTVAQLQLASGDQVVVGERPRDTSDKVLRFTGLLVGIATVAIAFGN
jgi:protein involved in polysaccharide export with SLBB domain